MKNILITGSTNGIGKLTAIELAKEGHQLYLHARSEEKLSKAIRELKESSGNPNISGFVADFSDLNQVKTMGETIAKTLNTLDVLINNAGVFKAKQAIAQSGYDLRFVVNYFAPFILTHQLLPLLKKSTHARIINLSSAAQQEVDLNAILNKKALNDQTAYAQSKLALTSWSIHLAHQEKELFVVPVNPGSLLNTRMVQEAFGRYWSSADKGAKILYKLALSDNLTNKSGQYFDNDQGHFSQAHPDAYDSKKTENLIQLTNSLLQQFI